MPCWKLRAFKILGNEESSTAEQASQSTAGLILKALRCAEAEGIRQGAGSEPGCGLLKVGWNLLWLEFPGVSKGYVTAPKYI